MTGTSATGAELFVDCLRAERVSAVFGNPGNSELPTVGALAGRDDVAYHLALHEAVVVGMAAGYALASGRPGVAHLHASPGLGNGMGNLYNAWLARTPLVVVAGQQDTRVALDEPLLHSDLVRQAEQYCKWAHEIRHPQDIPRAVRRAFKEAATPAHGPTFLSVPHEVQTALTEAAPLPSTRLRRGAPVDEDVRAAAAALDGARRPVLVVGDGVERSDCLPLVVDLAHRLGAAVWVEPFGQRLSYPPEDPLWRGYLPRNAPATREALGDADVVLVVGGDGALFIPPYEPGAPFPEGATTIHLHEAAEEIGRRHPVDVPVVADVALALAALNAAVTATARGRGEEVAALTAQEREAALADARAGWDAQPLEPGALFAALGEAFEGRILVDEAVSLSADLRRHFPHHPPRERFGNRTGGLGWGLPAALGVAVARPGQRVMCVAGDGSSLYVPQALWTAAHERLPVTLVVLDNGGYDINRLASRQLGRGEDGRPLGCDVLDPAVDWLALARGLGVSGHEATTADEVRELALRLADSEGPALLRVPVRARG